MTITTCFQLIDKQALTLQLCAYVLAADLCEIESDVTPHRSHVARVLQQTMGVYPDIVNLETRYLVRPTAVACQPGRPSKRQHTDQFLSVVEQQQGRQQPRWCQPHCL